MTKLMVVRVLSVHETYITVDAENEQDAREKAQLKLNTGDYAEANEWVRELPKEDWDVEVVN